MTVTGPVTRLAGPVTRQHPTCRLAHTNAETLSRLPEVGSNA